MKQYDAIKYRQNVDRKLSYIHQGKQNIHPYIIYNIFTCSLYFSSCLFESYIATNIGIEDHSNNCKGHLTIPNVSDKFRLHELYRKWILCRYFKVVHSVHFLYQRSTFITPLNAQSKLIQISPTYFPRSAHLQRQLVFKTGILFSLKMVHLYQNTL